MRKQLPVVLSLLLGAAFVFGLVQLFNIRFEAGDVYPRYSSLRADPLGTMALYESLQRVPGVSVRRDFSSGNQLPAGHTYLHLATTTGQWKQLPQNLVNEVEGFLSSGGRLVVTFLPEDSPFSLLLDEERAPSKKKNDKKEKKDRKKKKPTSEEEDPSFRLVSIKERWGLDFGSVPLPEAEVGVLETATVKLAADLALPDHLDWHSPVVFTNLPDSWRTIYSRGSAPVLVERSFGRGTFVLATDSFFLSNEALVKDRQPELLAWLVGSTGQVVFDESHFGIVENPGVATLIRKYRLHGLMGGLLLLAGLFIWKNMASFVPAYEDTAPPDFIAGKETAAGFVNLLRRNVSRQQVLRLCFDEWQKSAPRTTSAAAERAARAQKIVEAENARGPRERDPVKAYQEICRVLKPYEH
jgi:hypothetical protein